MRRHAKSPLPSLSFPQQKLGLPGRNDAFPASPTWCGLITAIKTDTRDSLEHVPSFDSHQPSTGTGAVHLLFGSACSLQIAGEGHLAWLFDQVRHSGNSPRLGGFKVTYCRLPQASRSGHLLSRPDKSPGRLGWQRFGPARSIIHQALISVHLALHHALEIAMSQTPPPPRRRSIFRQRGMQKQLFTNRLVLQEGRGQECPGALRRWWLTSRGIWSVSEERAIEMGLQGLRGDGMGHCPCTYDF